MGLFDIAAPLFDWIDTGFSGYVPEWLRLVVWGVIAAAISMALYHKLSAQRAMAAVKAESAEVRKSLKGYDGEFAGLWALLRRNIALSARLVQLAALPAIVASLPVIFLIVWLSNAYGYRLPARGALIEVRSAPHEVELSWGPESVAPFAPGIWHVSWPLKRLPIHLYGVGDEPIVTLPLAAPIPILHKRQWWNELIGNPAGYLPDDAAVDSLEFGLPERLFIKFGPDWMRGWATIFFTALVAFSIAIKMSFRIH